MAILAAIVALTVLGDFFIKVASDRPGAPWSMPFVLGAILYGMPARGWFDLMRTHSLAAIGVIYSASTILLLAALGTVAFGERLGGWEGLGIVLALASVVATGMAGRQ